MRITRPPQWPASPMQASIDRLQNAIDRIDPPKKPNDTSAILAEIDNISHVMKMGGEPVVIDGKTYVKDLTWEPRPVQQPTPDKAEPTSNAEVLAVAGFIQEMLEAKTFGTPEKPRACILEACVREGEDRQALRPRGTRIFRVFKSRTYQNYQLTAFNTAVPNKMARVYELEIKLTMGNEPA